MVSVKVYPKLFLLAVLVYVSVSTKQVVYADTETDCSTDLDIEDERYILTTDVAMGGCLVAANGIIIDGQGLYTINGGVESDHDVNGNAFDFTLQNITVNGSISSDALDGGDSGDISIIDSQINLGDYGGIYMRGGNSDDTHVPGDSGSITIINSSVFGYETRIMPEAGNGEYGDAGDGGRGGDVTITNSNLPDTTIFTVGGHSYSGNGGEAGAVSITDSNLEAFRSIGGGNTGSGNGGNGGTVSIVRSTVSVARSNGSDAGDVGGSGGEISITDSEVTNVTSYAGEGGVSDGNEGELILINTAPTISIEPEEESIAIADVYDPYAGVTADDVLDGDITDDVEVDGTVGSAAGTYTLTYSVTDGGMSTTFNGDPVSTDPETATGIRTVTRAAALSHNRRNGGSKVVPFEIKVVFLQEQLAALLGAYKNITGKDFSFASTNQGDTLRDLEFGMEGEDVKKLQAFLITQNVGPRAQALAAHGTTNLFGELTRDALIEYQVAKGITPAVGYFGPVTRAYISANGGL